MDSRFLQTYNTELQHLREMGAEFARQYPKVAGRLSLDEFECADPYVERLLEGFAFLTSRVQLKLEAEHGELTQHLLNAVYPNYLAPLPSMAMVQFQPDMQQSSLQAGHLIPRQTPLRGLLGKGDQTACEYRTGHDTTLWPIELIDADYVSRSAAAIELPAEIRNVKAAIRLTFRSVGASFGKIAIDDLPILLTGSEQLPMVLYEQILSDTAAILVRPSGKNPAWHSVLPPECVTAYGFAADQNLLPVAAPSFQGYRLIQEYFAFPQRFMFVRLMNLQSAIAGATEEEIEVIFALNRTMDGMDGRISENNFSLFCTPAINLFPKVADQITLNDNDDEHHVVADRTRALDFEVFCVNRVTGFGSQDREGQKFHPLYATFDVEDEADVSRDAYFTTRRLPRMLSDREKRLGPRSSYLGDEVYLSLVDPTHAPYDADLRQLRVETLCTNRDLSLQMPLNVGPSDFSLSISAPVVSVTCIGGPTAPKPSRANEPGGLIWQLVSSLSLNYLSISDLSDGRGALALRDLLKLFVVRHDSVMQRQIDGIDSLKSRRVVRRVPGPGPMTFGRGLEVTLNMDESAFDGSGPFLLASVLKEFFAKYVTMNSFAETVFRSTTRGEIKRWPANIGTRALM